MTTEHAAVTRFRAALAAAGGTGEVVVLPDSVHTAALAAEALGCEVGAIANSLVFEVRPEPAAGAGDGAGGNTREDARPEPSPVLLLTSGEHRVDTGATAARIGLGRLHRASPEFVRRHTGQVIGGVSPLAHPQPVPTWIDPWLRRHEVVWAAAGHPAAVFSTTFEELVAMTGAVEVDVTPEG